MDETGDVPGTGDVLRESGRRRAAHYLLGAVMRDKMECVSIRGVSFSIRRNSRRWLMYNTVYGCIPGLREVPAGLNWAKTARIRTANDIKCMDQDQQPTYPSQTPIVFIIPPAPCIYTPDYTATIACFPGT